MATSPRNSKTRSSPPPTLHEELLFDEILTRLPIDAAVRFQVVCREWHAAPTSAHFVAAHAAKAAAGRQPEIVFFSPTGPGTATSFYACSLPMHGNAPAVTTARELLTVGDLAGEHLVLSGNRPCRGLTLVFDVRSYEYYVFNLSTGEHLVLPPCEAAAEIEHRLPRFQRFPLELSSTGLGFDPATGEHKVVRLFRNIFEQQKCEVCSLSASGVWRWRPCGGGNAPPGFASHVDGRPPVAIDGALYWLLHTRSFIDGGRAGDLQLHDAPILSLSIGAERFGWVRTPPRLTGRIRHLTNLDGSLCAVVHDRLVDDMLLLLTWSSGTSPSWSARCRVDVGGLPRPIRGELGGMREIVPLCSSGNGKTILLATSRHKVIAYDVQSGDAEEVFDMNRYVDVPGRNSESQLLLNIQLHEERIAAGIGRTLAAGGAGTRLQQVKRGGGHTVVGKRPREVSAKVYQEHRKQDDNDHQFREYITQLAFPTKESRF
uniref:Uncharacterized protein n=1 Tax=Avena sativa TaxID=4498 RepID=A0ACD5VYM8_AVESA